MGNETDFEGGFVNVRSARSPRSSIRANDVDALRRADAIALGDDRHDDVVLIADQGTVVPVVRRSDVQLVRSDVGLDRFGPSAQELIELAQVPIGPDPPDAVPEWLNADLPADWPVTARCGGHWNGEPVVATGSLGGVSSRLWT
ncbi:MAG: hypothetical protein OER95_10875 [Acidimicrobiia bacterium]|nr:hypothetical protein [Acidimicrobiia bacterium]